MMVSCANAQRATASWSSQLTRLVMRISVHRRSARVLRSAATPRAIPPRRVKQDGRAVTLDPHVLRCSATTGTQFSRQNQVLPSGRRGWRRVHGRRGAARLELGPAPHCQTHQPAPPGERSPPPTIGEQRLLPWRGPSKVACVDGAGAPCTIASPCPDANLEGGLMPSASSESTPQDRSRYAWFCASAEVTLFARRVGG